MLKNINLSARKISSIRVVTRIANKIIFSSNFTAITGHLTSIFTSTKLVFQAAKRPAKHKAKDKIPRSLEMNKTCRLLPFELHYAPYKITLQQGGWGRKTPTGGITNQKGTTIRLTQITNGKLEKKDKNFKR